MISAILDDLKEDIRYTNRFQTIEEYIQFYKRISLGIFILGSLFMIGIFLIYFRFIDKTLIALAFIFSLIVWLLFTIYFYMYPKLAKADYLRNVESDMPLFLLYLYGLVSSGLPLYKALELVSIKGEEYPTIKRDIEYFVKLSNFLGIDMISSLLFLANTTKSKKLKEVIYELVSTVRSGGDIGYTIERLYENNMNEYENKLKSFIDKVEYILTIYAFVFIVFPTILLVTVFLFSVISGTSYLIDSTMKFSLIFFPFAYMIIFYLIYLIQPKV